jgi:CheY-like chemotaxis protein
MEVVLLVEDEKVLQESLSMAFQAKGVDTIKASNGEEGIMKAIEAKPDAIVMDILMPKLDGFQAVEKIRNTGEWGATVPILFLTNLEPETEENFKKIAEQRASYYLIKSNVDLKEVVSKVMELIGVA